MRSNQAGEPGMKSWGRLHLRTGDCSKSSTGTGKEYRACLSLLLGSCLWGPGCIPLPSESWVWRQGMGMGGLGGWALGRTTLRRVASPAPYTERSSLHLHINPLSSAAGPAGPRPPTPGAASPPLSQLSRSDWLPWPGPSGHGTRRRPRCAQPLGAGSARVKVGTMWAGRVLHAALSAAPRSRRAQSALTQLRGVLEEELEAIRGAGTWKSERVITSRQGPRIHVDGVSGGILNFCANNYLGLSSHPKVIQAGLQALEEFGAGLSSTRFICGTQSIHKDLEAKIACFHQREDAILYPSCFDANAGLFEALLAPQDAVLSDELNHASIIDGIRLCKAHKYRYRHLDMADLEAKLQEAQKHRLRLVATDGAFSMDGDIAPLREICHLASRYGALVFVDECHATGFLGATGRGTDELLGVMDQVTIINSTLGKALGGASGGYTTGPGPLVSLLRQRSRPYLFSNSLPPAVAGCASKALDLLMESNAIVQSMAAKTQRFRSKMEAAGFTVLGASHPICPVMLGDARLASCMADDMLKRGIFVIGFSYPVVPKDKARIRVQISAVHSEEDIDRCVEAFVEVGRLHGALP